MVNFNYFGHLIIGALLGLCISNQPTDLLIILLGSLLPDIDIKTSTLGRFNPFSKFMKHRGKTHTIIGSFLLSSPFLLIDVNSFLMLYYGCLSHILGDKIKSLFSKQKFKIKLW